MQITSYRYISFAIGTSQELRNAVGCRRVSDFLEKSDTRMYGSTLLALREGGWVSDFQKKLYITLEWPQTIQLIKIGKQDKKIRKNTLHRLKMSMQLPVADIPRSTENALFHKGAIQVLGLHTYITLFSGNYTPTHPLVTLITLNITPS